MLDYDLIETTLTSKRPIEVIGIRSQITLSTEDVKSLITEGTMGKKRS